MAYKGKFTPKNPERYKGNAGKIIYRSLWELKLMRTLDTSPNVIWWSSEELEIPYISPHDLKRHRYYPDFIVRRKSSSTGEINTIVIEVKPAKQCTAPIRPETQDRRKLRRFMREDITYKVNKAKWDAAREFCEFNNWKFVIMDEYSLGIKDKPTSRGKKPAQ